MYADEFVIHSIFAYSYNFHQETYLDQIWKDLLTTYNLCSITHVVFPFQGCSSSWWNNMHYQHHAKPNVVSV